MQLNKLKSCVHLYFVLVLIRDTTASQSSNKSGCATELDCSLNGECKNSKCVCYSGWYGETCGKLDVYPTETNSGYNQTNYSTWGGSIIKGDDGRWHMFVSRFSENCGLSSWVTNSEIVQATSQTPYGHYSFLRVVVERFSHNPGIHYVSGKYLLFHIGCGQGIPSANVSHCLNGTTPSSSIKPNKFGGCENPHYENLMTSDSLNGSEWKSQGEINLFTPRNETAITNPAYHFFDNGSVYSIYRQPGGAWPKVSSAASERIGAAMATSCITGINCTYVDKSPEFPLFDFALEDVYVWVDANANYHALTHKKKPAYGPRGDSGHIFSTDGIHWYISKISPYNDTIYFKDGTTFSCKKRARPKLVIENGAPIALSTGCEVSRETGDHTITTVQPIGTD